MNTAPEANFLGLHPAPPDSPALRALVQALRERHGEGVNAILFYGSCLRGGDLYDGLVDLYLIVDSYRACYPDRLGALANWLLPPNVFYTEIPQGGRTLRAKYAILSVADLLHGTSHRWFHSYLWGRFTQPTAVAWCRNESTRRQLNDALASAVHTFLERILPVVPAAGRVRDLWQQGLQLSYGAELRSEQPGRSGVLTDAALEYYCAATRLAAASLRYPLHIEGNSREARYQARIPATRRRLGHVAWWLRRIQGKLLSILRLLKALFTFDGGLDYLAWKLERHSGQHIEIPERVRRYPLIFIWGLFWQLYRRGIFR
ncbi:MAG: hypothetical protein PVJ15_07820 [Gammaproteobacteria bacterium]